MKKSKKKSKKKTRKNFVDQLKNTQANSNQNSEKEESKSQEESLSSNTNIIVDEPQENIKKTFSEESIKSLDEEDVVVKSKKQEENDNSFNNYETYSQTDETGSTGIERGLTSIFVKIKFPEVGVTQNYPIDSPYKVINFGAQKNINNLVSWIQRTYSLPRVPSMGLYSTLEKRWLPNDALLEQFADLENMGLEYRDKRKPINIGSTRERRKYLQRSPSSPFFQEWIKTFKGEIKRKEEQKRREEYVARIVKEDPLGKSNELQSKLEELASPISSQKIRKRSCSFGSKLDETLQNDVLIATLKQKTEDARIAAEIGKSLLEQNANLSSQLKELKEKYEKYRLNEQLLNDKNEEIEELKSKNILLNNRLEVAISENEKLFRELSNTNAKISKSQQRSHISTALSDDLELTKLELEKEQSKIKTLQYKLSKSIEEKEKLMKNYEQLQENVIQFKEEHNEVISLKNQIKLLSNQNIELEHQLIQLNESENVAQTFATKEELFNHLISLLKSITFEESKEDSKSLISSTVEVIQKMYNDLEQGTSSNLFLQVIELLSSNIQDSIKSIQDKNLKSVNTINIYFLLSLISTLKLEEQQQKLKDYLMKESELIRDIQELKESLNSEKKSKSKLLEQLEGLQNQMDEVIQSEISKRITPSLSFETEELQTQLHEMQQRLEEQVMATQAVEKKYVELLSTFEEMKSKNQCLISFLQKYEQSFQSQMQTTSTQVSSKVKTMHTSILKINQQLQTLKDLLEFLEKQGSQKGISQEEREEKKILSEETVILKAKIEELTNNSSPEPTRDLPYDIKRTPSTTMIIKFKHESNPLTTEDERIIEFLNHLLQDDSDVKAKLPIGLTSLEVAEKTVDGIILCKLINLASPGTIDERVIKFKPKSMEEMSENHNLCIFSAMSIGITKNVISSQEWLQGNSTQIMVFVKAILEVYLTSRVSIRFHSELILLKDPNENRSFNTLETTELLIRWVNYYLKISNQKLIQNLGEDLSDSRAYIYLLNQLFPEKLEINQNILESDDVNLRSKEVINMIKKTEFDYFLFPKAITEAKQRCNLFFLCHLFDKFNGLKLSPVESVKVIELGETDESISREERVFKFWLNSLGINVKNLSEDMQDGLVILNILDNISPGIVNWSKVNSKPSNAYQKIENCNYCVELALSLKFSIVGIGGNDFYTGNIKLILALIWQCMRHQILSILKNIKSRGNNKEVTENDILQWANQKVASQDKPSSIKSFKDPILRDSKFLLNLINAIKPGLVDYSIIKEGKNEEECKLNAQYALSLSRKIGCCLFLLWEDIVEVRPKMIMVLLGTLMYNFS